MKTFIRTSALAIAFLTILAGTASAESSSPVYSRRANPSIGITPAANAVGYSYAIVDANGRTVASGRISSCTTFYLPTAQLKRGSYQFVIAGNNAQSFTIK